MLDIKGLKSGAVLQRDQNDFCKITISASFSGEPKASMGKLTHIEKNKWELTGIYLGGPYNLTIEDSLDSATFTDIYVGDLWLLAGQSNMEGAGRMTAEDEFEAQNFVPFIRAFYMDDTWDSAKPMLHQLSFSKDPSHKKAWSDGLKSLEERGIDVFDNPPYSFKRKVGPGYYFAKEMFALTDGVPQGVIPAAVGGAAIEAWLPLGENNHFTAAMRRIEETGSSIKGVFWAQGEGNTEPEAYPSQIELIRKALCEKTGRSVMPFVQLQSFKCTLAIGDPNTDRVWSRFREMQRKMPENAQALCTVATNDLSLEDCIHLSSDSQKTAGVRGARAMHYLVSGCGFAEPTIDKIYLSKTRYIPNFSTDIHIRYKNISGALRSKGVPSGFTLRQKDEIRPTEKMFRKISLCQNEVIISVEIPTEKLKDCELWYGFGNDFYCNITDGENRALPAMGPIPLLEEN